MPEQSIMSSVPSIWASMNSWFTPTVFFVLLNLMIGTIAITSSLASTNKPNQNQNQNQQQQEQEQENQQQPHHHQAHGHLARSPSMLQRLKSINFYNYTSQEPNTTLIQQVSQDFDSHFTSNTTLIQQVSQDFDSHFTFHQQQEQAFHQEQQQQQQQQPPPLSRSPSILQRLKSVNLNDYLPHQVPIFSTPKKSQETHPVYHSTSEPAYGQNQELEDPEADEESEPETEQTLDEVYSKLQSSNKVSRSNSDTKPVSGDLPTKLPKKLKKSVSAKSAVAHSEEEEIVESRRPATVREGKGKATEEDDAEVDARADDFINKFKQQLKLQRIDSILRYKEIINRGTAGAK